MADCIFCHTKERIFSCESCGEKICKGCIYRFKFHSRYDTKSVLCGKCFFKSIDVDEDIRKFIYSIQFKEGEKNEADICAGKT